MKNSSFIFCISLLLFSLSDTHAQKFNIGGGFGGMNYKGDLSPNFNPRFFRPGASAFVRYNLSRSVSLRTGFLGGSIGADDKYSNDPFNKTRNMSFKTSIAEWNAIAEYNFLNYSTKARHINWTPYIFGGLAYYHFQPQAYSGGYNLNQISIPFGVGVKWEVHRPWSLEFEFGTRKLFTDYIDNFSGAAPINQKYTQGIPALKDVYYYASVSVSYTFYKIICP